MNLIESKNEKHREHVKALWVSNTKNTHNNSDNRGDKLLKQITVSLVVFFSWYLTLATWYWQHITYLKKKFMFLNTVKYKGRKLYFFLNNISISMLVIPGSICLDRLSAVSYIFTKTEKLEKREKENAKTDSDKSAQSTKAVELINTHLYPLVTIRWLWFWLRLRGRGTSCIWDACRT